MNNNVTIKVNKDLLPYMKGENLELTIDSVQDYILESNTDISVSLEPGEHSVKMFFKYLGANCGFATAKFSLGGYDRVTIEYNPPEILAMGGSISINTKKVEPKPEHKPDAKQAQQQKQPQQQNQNHQKQPQKQVQKQNQTPEAKPAQHQTPQKPAAQNTQKPVQQSISKAPQATVAPAPKPVNKPVYNAEPTSYATPTGEKKVRSKYVAAVLAFLLGGIGIHKFYTGKIFMGIVYIFFCQTQIPTIISIIEGIIYLRSSSETFNKKYCK